MNELSVLTDIVTALENRYDRLEARLSAAEVKIDQLLSLLHNLTVTVQQHESDVMPIRRIGPSLRPFEYQDIPLPITSSGWGLHKPEKTDAKQADGPADENRPEGERTDPLPSGSGEDDRDDQAEDQGEAAG